MHSSYLTDLHFETQDFHKVFLKGGARSARIGHTTHVLD